MDESSKEHARGRLKTQRANGVVKQPNEALSSAEKCEDSPSPHISQEIDKSDPNHREYRAYLDLFRWVSIGKMIAVVGSGVTTTYGYDSWKSMLRKLVCALESMHNENRDLFFTQHGLNLAIRLLQKPDSENGNGDEDYDLSVYGSLFPHLTHEGREEVFKKYRNLFGPRQLVKRSAAEDVLGDAPIPQTTAEYLPQDFSHFLSRFAALADTITAASGNNQDIKKKVETDATRNDTERQRIASDRNIVDPLEKIRSALRVKRFATFNYDLEIEALLEDYDYPYGSLTGNIVSSTIENGKSKDDQRIAQGQSRLGSVARSVSLSKKNASELISLAASSSDDDETIVHLHGSVSAPETMVVTQDEYDAVYIEQHPLRHAYEDARKLMFGGNCILYVGVGMREEDVLRPLRYLASVASERPIYALIPSLESSKKDIALKKKIKDAYRINAISFGPGSDNIPKLLHDLNIPHPLGTKFIALHQEIGNIKHYITEFLRGKDITADDYLNREKTPRLFKDAKPYFDFLAGLPKLADKIGIAPKNISTRKRKAVIDSQAAQEFIEASKSVAISIALNHAVELTAAAARQWRTKWRIDHTSDRIDRSAKRLDSLHVTPLKHHLAIDRNKARSILKRALEHDGHASIVWFNDGRGMGSFSSMASMIGPIQVSRPKSASHRIVRHEINMNHVVDANSLFPRILDAIANYRSTEKKNVTHVFLIQDAERLMDQSGTEVQNLAAKHFLDSLHGMSAQKDERIVTKVLILSRRKRTAEKLSEIFGHGSLIPQDYRRLFHEHRIDINRHKSIVAMSQSYRLPNLMISALCDIFMKKEERKTVLDLLESHLDSKIHNIDIKNRQAVFCGAVLDTLHAYAQRNMPVEDRVGLVAQHAILKWMFAIRIPVDCNTMEIIPEIEGIHSRYQKILLGSDKHLHLFVRNQMQQLRKMYFIHALAPPTNGGGHDESWPMENDEPGTADLNKSGADSRMKSDNIDFDPSTTRFVLHEHAARYLAHKRGLSFGWMNHREWNAATLCNAMMDGGPLLSENDYRTSCEVYESLISSGNQRPLKCAYAIIRGHLYAPNAMRAGLMYPENDEINSVIDIHIGRLSRLRTAALHLKRRRGSLMNFEHFEVWMNNEIGALKYTQGDCHDAVMLFRECLDFVKHDRRKKTDENDYGIGSDPALIPRIRINLSMALIERAHFEQAGKIINSVLARLDRIGDLPMHQSPSLRTEDPKPKSKDDLAREHKRKADYYRQPESMLLRALAYGCRAQIDLLTADLETANQSILDAIMHTEGSDMLGVRGWLYGLHAQIACASGNHALATELWLKSLASGRGSLRPDLILDLEIAEIGFRIRTCNGDRSTALTALSALSHLESSARRLGSHKARVEILLIRARALLSLEQTDIAREAIIDAICLSLLNGMRLKRISGLVLMTALMAQRGEREAARKLLRTIRLTASRLRFVSASFDIDRLEREIELEGSISSWAGYLLAPPSIESQSRFRA